MRLLFVSHSLPPEDRPLANLGGMQRVALELDHAFSIDPGIEYDRLVLRATWDSVHLRTPPFLAATWRDIRRRMRAGSVDVVLFSSMVTASLAVPLRHLAGRSGVRLAAIVHGLDVTTAFAPYQWFVPRVFDALDLVMPVSRATGDACMARGLARDRMIPIGNGVDIDRFPPLVTDRASRRRLLHRVFATMSVPGEDTFVLVSVGRHVRRKGFEWFIRQVLPGLPSNVHYWLAGEGPETTAIATAIRDTGLSTRVRLLGRVSEEEVHALYAGGDLFVMPNIPVDGDMEGFGVVMLEAALGGLPTVGSRLEGIAEVIQDGKNGWLVESMDAHAFIDAIRALAGRPDLLEAAAVRAAAHTRANHAWPAVATRYRETLARLVSAGPIESGSTRTIIPPGSHDPRATGEGPEET